MLPGYPKHPIRSAAPSVHHQIAVSGMLGVRGHNGGYRTPIRPTTFHQTLVSSDPRASPSSLQLIHSTQELSAIGQTIVTRESIFAVALSLSSLLKANFSFGILLGHSP
eukprot:scaffold284154_cov209-Cyclotella_meneghiniana.AAC.2